MVEYYLNNWVSLMDLDMMALNDYQYIHVLHHLLEFSLKQKKFSFIFNYSIWNLYPWWILRWNKTRNYWYIRRRIWIHLFQEISSCRFYQTISFLWNQSISKKPFQLLFRSLYRKYSFFFFMTKKKRVF
jgi:hypothetical protein